MCKCRVCACGCVQVCMGVCEYVRVCTSVRGYAQVRAGVDVYAWVCVVTWHRDFLTLCGINFTESIGLSQSCLDF